MSFSWRSVAEARGDDDVRPPLPKGRYACDPIDQHSKEWCGACYAVATLQMLQDRIRIQRSAHRDAPAPIEALSVQDLVDDLQRLGTVACAGGYAEQVVHLLHMGVCRLRREGADGWTGQPRIGRRQHRGHPLDVCVSPMSVLPPSVDAVKRAIAEFGPVLLDVAYATVLSCDPTGTVSDLTPREADHTVCVVGWGVRNGAACWLARNSWGTHGRGPRSSDGRRDTPWLGDPDDPGFFWIPMAYAPLTASGEHGSPWMHAHVSHRRSRSCMRRRC